MNIDDFLDGTPSAVCALMPQTLRVQRIWIDGRDRCVSLPRRAAAQELQERLGDWRAAVELLRTGCVIHTRAARYRAIADPPSEWELP
jgi:hypothetical protein